MDKTNLVLYFLLMLISGLLIYYLYLRPEAFEITTLPQTTQSTTSTDTQIEQSQCPQITVPTLPLAVLSRYFGVGFNIYPVDNTSASSISTNTGTNKFMIEHIPVVFNGSLGSMYAVVDGLLTIKLRNEKDSDQWWVFTQSTDSSSSYITITPFSTQNTTPQYALQYENGNLALRPANPTFESQKWVYSNNKVTRGVPVMNYSPASLFTPEFNPYTTSNITDTSSLTQHNNQQVNDVINLIKTNIQQYLNTVGASSTSQNITPISQSALGNKEMPLNINVNLGSGVSTRGISTFDNITGTTTGTDIISLLNKYETNQNPTPMSALMNSMDLQSALKSNDGCSNINLNDYTSNRVSTCNCKL